MKKSILFLASLFFLISGNVFASTKKVKVTLTSKNTVALRGEVTYANVADVFYKAKKLAANLSENKPLFLVIDSPGGSISAGLELIRNLKSLDVKVHTITVYGASMGFIIGQLLNARLVTEDGVLMSHKASGNFAGEFPGQLDSRYDFWLERVSSINSRISKRTRGVHTLESYEKLIENEYWCSGEHCDLHGFVDYIVSAKCDESLTGHYTVKNSLVLMGFSVSSRIVFDMCPLNTAPLDSSVLVNGQVIFGNGVTNNDIFKDTPDLKKLLPEIKKIIGNDKTPVMRL